MSFINTKGLDISYANGDVDFGIFKRNGFKFVMIRSGFGNDEKNQDDGQFSANVEKAEAAGIPWGVYHFTYAYGKDAALSEVAHVDRLLKAEKEKGHVPTMPIALDVEYSDYLKNIGGWTRSNLTTIAETFLDKIRNMGYYPMIYTGYDVLDNMVSDHIRNDFDCWFAQWSSSPSAYKYDRLGIWQYGGEANYLKSPYIEGKIFDQNICYKDYPEIIKKGGYNGWKSRSSNIKKPVEMLAFEVLDGRWGSQDERKEALTEAGYDYQAVQNRVNEICESWKNPTLDKTGYKLGDSNIAILAIKELLINARKLGIITQGVDESKGYGDGTLIATNQILKIGNYNQNGIIGENFVKYLSKLIKEKMIKK